MRRFVGVRFARLHEKEIHQAVLVVVKPSDAGAHGFEIILFFGLRGVLQKSNSGFFSDVGVADSYARVLRIRIWSLLRESLLMEDHANCRAQRQDGAAHAHKKPSPVCLRFFSHSKVISTVSVSSAARP